MGENENAQAWFLEIEASLRFVHAGSWYALSDAEHAGYDRAAFV